MGVDSFHTRAEGPTLQAAFERARDDAVREHGTSPYAGTVYSKTEVEFFDEPPRPELLTPAVPCWPSLRSSTSGLSLTAPASAQMVPGSRISTSGDWSPAGVCRYPFIPDQ